jgi:hypothetical protein
MAQKANPTPVDKYESDRREAERLDLEKDGAIGGLIDPVSSIQPAPTARHQHREGLFVLAGDQDDDSSGPRDVRI